MDDIFIVGLPRDLRSRIESTVVRSGAQVKSVLAANGTPVGSLKLLPYPGQAAHDLRSFLDERTAWSQIQILILPYAPLPTDLLDEIRAVEEYVGIIHLPKAGEGGWPPKPKHAPNKQFTDALLPLICSQLFPSADQLPSAFFAELVEECKQILIPAGAIDECDTVSPLRHTFFIDAGRAIRDFLSMGGDVGRVSEFFEGRGLLHAQSGGIYAAIEVIRNGQTVYTHRTQTHLKKGDKTSARAAVRLYYHFFPMDGDLYAAILYAGPHPDTDVKRWAYLE